MHVTSMAISPQKELIACGGKSSGIVELWNVRSLKLIKRIEIDCSGIMDLSFSSDGKSLAVGGGDGSIRVLRSGW